MIIIKRIYEKPDNSDGFRVLVDHLWPRGISKEKAALDLWLKDIAPSNELRIWFAHDPKKWMAFKTKYTAEIKRNKEASNQLKEITKKQKKVTLLYAAKDEEHNEALVLKNMFS